VGGPVFFCAGSCREGHLAPSKRANPVSCFHRVLKRYNKGVRIRFLIVPVALLATVAVAQDSSDKAASDKAADKAAARDREADESSSRATRIDISPPKDDEKNHPASKSAVADLVPDNPDTSGIQEFHPWNPFKASKDIDIGNFYFNRKNYRAALDRYKEALYYKDGDAVASFRVAVCQEKLGDKAEAKKYFEQYLKILPEGPLAKDARASLERLAK
jgi:tetratricopeptide (TPR) repeat protein